MATAIKADPGMGDYHSGEYIFGFCHALFLSRLRSTCLSLDWASCCSLDWASCCPWLPVRTRILCRLPEHLIALRLSLAPATTFTLQRQDKLRQDSLDRRQHRTCGCTPHVPATMGVGIHALLQRTLGIPCLHICAHVRNVWMNSQRTLVL
jgi:hypothetical protein